MIHNNHLIENHYIYTKILLERHHHPRCVEMVETEKSRTFSHILERRVCDTLIEFISSDFGYDNYYVLHAMRFVDFVSVDKTLCFFDGNFDVYRLLSVEDKFLIGEVMKELVCKVYPKRDMYSDFSKLSQKTFRV